MSRKIYIAVCKTCNYRNPSDAKICNGCGNKLSIPQYIFFGGIYDGSKPNYDLKWACPECGLLNYSENETCSGCLYTEKKKKNSWF